MKKLTWLLIILTIAVVGLAGCTSTEAPAKKDNQEQKDQENESSQESSKSWISSIDETIMIEGMEESITLKFFDGESNFITYVPQDILVESKHTDEGNVYRFYANYGGNKKEDIYLQLSFFPKKIEEKPEMTGENGEFSLQGLNMQPINTPEKINDWSLEEYYSTDGSAYGMLGKHEEQYFSMIIHYSGEYGEGFVPRANKIIEHLYWTDTNEYLVKQ